LADLRCGGGCGCLVAAASRRTARPKRGRSGGRPKTNAAPCAQKTRRDEVLDRCTPSRASRMQDMSDDQQDDRTVLAAQSGCCGPWEDLNLRLHPYQVSRAKRCAQGRFPRSHATVRGQGMRSNSPPDQRTHPMPWPPVRYACNRSPARRWGCRVGAAAPSSDRRMVRRRVPGEPGAWSAWQPARPARPPAPAQQPARPAKR
jgi:hypothetical protein